MARFLPLQRSPLSAAALLVCLGAAATAVPAPAQTRSERLLSATSATSAPPAAVSIAAGPLDRALNQYAAATGLMLAIDGTLTAGKSSPGLAGSYSVELGLSKLLEGSGLQAVRMDNGGFVIRRPIAGAQEERLPQVTVVSNRQENAWGPVDGNIARRSATSTKTDTPLIETPRSISVVTAAQIEAQQPRDLNDAFGYMAGIVRSEGSDRTTDSFYIRGFSAGAATGSLYRDGSKYMVNAYDGQQELYGLERAELLKGAASVLYGTAAPGGIINTVSKRPTVEPLHELGVELGNNNRRQVKGDFSGALTDDGVWSYRLTGLLRDSDTFIDYVPDNRQFLAGALTWRPDARTSLTLQADYVRSRTDYVYGLPAVGTILPNPNGVIPSNRYLGLVGHDKYDGANTSLGYLFEHAFSDQLRLRHSAHVFRSNVDFPGSGVEDLSTDQTTSTYRGAYERYDYSKAFTTDTSLEYKLQTGDVSHTLLAGVDTMFQYHTTARGNRDVDPQLNYYNPGYSYTLSDITPNTYYPDSSSHDTGLYLQDQMKFGKHWVLLLGGRHDWASDRQMPVDGTAATRETSSANTGHAGVVYLADNGLAPYVSFSQSFQPQSGADRSSNRFKPTQGEQYEAGIRYQPQGGDTMLSAAVYQLTQQNVLSIDPVDTNFSVQTGEIRSRGAELDARTKIGGHANLIASYAYTDARVTADNNTDAVGKRRGMVPYNQASAWVDYDFGLWGMKNLKVGGGVRYVGSTLGLYVAGSVPAYTLVDAMVAYETGPWRLSLNATNLGDKEYIASCSYACFYGDRRKVVAAAVYRW